MAERCHGKLLAGLWAMVGVCFLGAGCQTCPPCNVPCDSSVPRELAKVSLPAYVIEPPDILLIDAVRLVPLPPYRIEPLDALLINALDVFPTEPIQGVYGVEPDGTVTLGLTYGTVRVAGLTLDEARQAIEKQLRQFVKTPRVLVSLAQSRGLQQIRGEHLVRPDGTVGLGSYGSVYVAGLTLQEAKAAIEEHLSRYLLKPEVSLDVFAYNSKVFYVITDGAGFGQQVVRLPITVNETVLDAISQVNGLAPTASKKRIWIARPSPAEVNCEQVLAVDWKAITQKGISTTNYQILPGDRVYVQGDALITLDNALAKFLAPIERAFGITLLGTGTVSAITFFRQQGTLGGGGIGGGGGF